MCALVNNNKCQRRAKVTVAKGVGVGALWVAHCRFYPPALLMPCDAAAGFIFLRCRENWKSIQRWRHQMQIRVRGDKRQSFTHPEKESFLFSVFSRTFYRVCFILMNEMDECVGTKPKGLGPGKDTSALVLQ